jgi:transcription elongation factor GreA
MVDARRPLPPEILIGTGEGMASNYMTKGQYDRHAQQIHLLEEKIAEARHKVGEAAKHGDLSENAEYDAAREEVEFLTGRYEEMTAFLVGMQIVDAKRTDPKTITIGKTVTLKDRKSGEQITYNVVGGGYASPELKEISYKAPLAAGLIGKKAGDVVDLQVPEGTRRVEIVSIKVYEQ